MPQVLQGHQRQNCELLVVPHLEFGNQQHHALHLTIHYSRSSEVEDKNALPCRGCSNHVQVVIIGLVYARTRQREREREIVYFGEAVPVHATQAARVCRANDSTESSRRCCYSPERAALIALPWGNCVIYKREGGHFSCAQGNLDMHLCPTIYSLGQQARFGILFCPPPETLWEEQARSHIHQPLYSRIFPQLPPTPGIWELFNLGNLGIWSIWVVSK